ncbi:MAG TPA: hypothetical protein PLJ27_22000 [Polyangiaceae bacterium]|nr:MAG: hypothetical protein BWY17_01921 [Deltaproteobacteria bacterium ADurb.Bin207]HNS98581.1 hypothetical protein [Polyangiaceae bacterium]HNZ23700.1 hypothetical protein [Polyangiaceae bacterium]HOD23410.1 hypothetical protein [Polyangiaceae bacterium]HOE49614.1 hypothetical protein [Polyangiaceae bacterium]
MPILELRCCACGIVFHRPASAAQQDQVSWRLSTPMALMSPALEVETLRCPRCHDLRVEPVLRSFRPDPSRSST